MSASSPLSSLSDKVAALEAELDGSRLDFDYAVAQTQEFRDQYDELHVRYTALRSECSELKVDNRRLTKKLNESDAQFASPPIAAQSDEVAPLRRQLAEKDKVIAAQDEKYQSLLNSIKPVFKTLFVISSMTNWEVTQSCLAAMPKDAAKTLEALQNETAPGGPPSDGNAGSKTSVTHGATKTPPERPSSRSRPDPEQQPESSIGGPGSYSNVVTSKRAEHSRRGRAGQAKVPVSHEDLARQEALRAEKREEIQSSAGRSQKPNKVGGFQPPQKVAGGSPITGPPVPEQKVNRSPVPHQPIGHSFVFEPKRPSSPAPKQNVTSSRVTDQPIGHSFVFEPKRPSSPVPKEKVGTLPPPSLKGTQGSASRGQTPTGPVTQTDLGKTTTSADPTVTNPQIQGKSKDLMDTRSQTAPNASVSKESEQSAHQVASVGPLDSRQAPYAPFPPPARPQEVGPKKYSFDDGDDDEEPYVKAPTGYVPPPFLRLFDTDTVPQTYNPQESSPQKSVTQEPTSQVSTKDAIDTPKNAFNWASDTESRVSKEEQRKLSPFWSGKIKAEGHTQTHPRGQGQPHPRGQGQPYPRGQGQPHHRARGGGRGIQAPPSHSNPENYILDRPWRRGNAAKEGSSPSPQPIKFNETWRKTASSDGTRKVVSVQKSESVHGRSDEKLVEKRSVMGGEGGVALAKQAGTGEAATSSPKAGDK